MLESNLTKVTPIIPGLIENEGSSCVQLSPEPPAKPVPKTKRRTVRFCDKVNEDEEKPKGIFQRKSTSYHAQNHQNTKSSLKENLFSNVETPSTIYSSNSDDEWDGDSDEESEKELKRKADRLSAETEIIQEKGRLIVRTKSMAPNASSIVESEDTGSKRKSSQLRRLKRKMQSIYKDNDIWTDDRTAEHTKHMVTGFNDVSVLMDRSVEGQAFWAIFGLVINIIQREIDYNTSEDQCDYYSGIDLAPARIVVNFLRLLVTITTFIMIYHFYNFHSCRVTYESLNKEFMAWETIWSSSRNYWPFLKDCFFYCIHEPPFIMWCTDIATSHAESIRDSDVTLPNGFGLLMFFRLFLVLRYTSTKMYRGGTKILGIWHNFDFGLGFTIRNLLYVHPMRTLGPPICTMILIAWYCLHSCERQADGGLLESGWDSLWVLCVTVTTVGYGDIYPSTECGRWTLVTTAFMSQLVTAVLISTLHQKLCLMPFESRMVEFLAHANSTRELRTNAANVIACGWRYTKARRTRRGDTEKELKALTDAIYTFERHRNTVKAYDRRYRNDQLIRSMLEDISKQTEEAKLYYSAANQLAAATGHALKMDKKKDRKRRDGTLRGFDEATYTVVDKRSHSERSRKASSIATNNSTSTNADIDVIAPELIAHLKESRNTIMNLEAVVKQNAKTIQTWMRMNKQTH